MGRYAQTDASERRTARLDIKISPTEQAELRALAARRGARPSAFARALIFRRLTTAGAAPEARDNADASALVRQLKALGNNVNQLTKHANETRRIALEAELRALLAEVKRAIAHVLDL